MKWYYWVLIVATLGGLGFGAYLLLKDDEKTEDKIKTDSEA